jgi:hypothetical protein
MRAASAVVPLGAGRTLSFYGLFPICRARVELGVCSGLAETATRKEHRVAIETVRPVGTAASFPIPVARAPAGKMDGSG